MVRATVSFQRSFWAKKKAWAPFEHHALLRASVAVCQPFGITLIDPSSPL
jgi:hypothetical protein